LSAPILGAQKNGVMGFLGGLVGGTLGGAALMVTGAGIGYFFNLRHCLNGKRYN
jgi:hypothetical protein